MSYIIPCINPRIAHLMNFPNCTHCDCRSYSQKNVERQRNGIEKYIHVAWQTDPVWEPCSEVATPEQCDCRPNEAQEQGSWHWHCMDKSCLLYQCRPKEREFEDNCHIGKMDEPQEEDSHNNEMDCKACAESTNSFLIFNIMTMTCMFK